MNKKNVFIKEVEGMISEGKIIFSDEAMMYFEALKGGDEKEKPLFTENGKLILQFMKENKESFGNLFKAKDVGEGLGITSRTASGAMRKLVTDGYIERMGESPVVYAVTEKGFEVELV